MSDLRDSAAFRDAVALHQAGKFSEAAAAYQALIEIDPTEADLWHFKGLAELHQGHGTEAARLISLALTLKPGALDYLMNLGLAQKQAGDAEQAADTFNKFGNLLQEQCRFVDALETYDHSLALHVNPSVLINRGAALDRLGRYESAAEDFNRALDALKRLPPSAGTWLNIANAYSGLGELTQALEAYDEALALDPDMPTAHCSRAILSLRLGRMEEGWKEYEWRWRRDGGFREPRGFFKQPVWHGEKPEALDGTLLVIAEQGFGDTIQFARYIPLLAAQGYDVLFETLPELQILFAEGFNHPKIRAIPRVETPQAVQDDLPFAAYVGVMSLPERFATTLETIPGAVPYLSIKPERRTAWQERLNTDDKVPKVGLVWSGNPRNMNDFARSCPLEAFAPLLARKDCAFYSLQKGPEAARDFPGVKLGDELKDFVDTGAALQEMDLLISVDTSVVHLAGALGRPVWMMIAAMPDWRWLMHGDTSAWYPSLRIFRQRTRGNWATVIEDLNRALDQWVKTHV